MHVIDRRPTGAIYLKQHKSITTKTIGSKSHLWEVSTKPNTTNTKKKPSKTMATEPSKGTTTTTTTTKKNLKRSLSERLKTKAPSSIQVNPPSEQVKEWKVAIPLLSPLCGSPSPRIGDRTVERERSRSAEPYVAEERTATDVARPRKNPAEFFFYEPTAVAAPVAVPAFFVPNCT
ncbi:hypothetical protein QJS10_CPB21g00376 [Acorus calamus]|uniref:Uncharacterized protein n=1 Tax=Acorus calamus TaxID=4465 RepID=A0AAV9C3H1_ACOCL|nr:hypothetical protein QJS10_CPB21g00376 [Acorus calamus]